MRDGRTRRVELPRDGAAEDFLARHRASLTILRGPAAGTEHEVAAPRLLIGRSAAAAVRLDDRSVSHEHAALEIGATGVGIRDLGSTNGVRVNGARVESSTLSHGDRIHIGQCELQLVVERRGGRAWQL